MTYRDQSTPPTDLIQRLEAATEGSRELEEDIALSVVWRRLDGGTSAIASGVWQSPCDFWGGLLLPCFTRSIDAALTLLPEGYGAVSASFNEQGRSSVRIAHPYVSGNGATPALATVIAALKAREAE